MFKKTIAICLLLSFSAQAFQSDLSCYSVTTKGKGKLKTVQNSLRVEKGSLGALADDTSQSYLMISNHKGQSASFGGTQVEEISTRYHRVILADNGQNKARIVVDQAGRADVSMQNPDGSYSILRKVIKCTKF